MRWFRIKILKLALLQCGI